MLLQPFLYVIRPLSGWFPTTHTGREQVNKKFCLFSNPLWQSGEKSPHPGSPTSPGLKEPASPTMLLPSQSARTNPPSPSHQGGLWWHQPSDTICSDGAKPNPGLHKVPTLQPQFSADEQGSLDWQAELKHSTVETVVVCNVRKYSSRTRGRMSTLV